MPAVEPIAKWGQVMRCESWTRTAASGAVASCLCCFVHVLSAVRVSQLLLSVSNHTVHAVEALGDTPMGSL